eukprot:Awhi_evm1s13620
MTSGKIAGLVITAGVVAGGVYTYSNMNDDNDKPVLKKKKSTPPPRLEDSFALTPKLKNSRGQPLPSFQSTGTKDIGVTLTQGFYRDYMEDEFVVYRSSQELRPDYLIAGVFDGHGGGRTSKVAKARLVENLLRPPPPSNYFSFYSAYFDSEGSKNNNSSMNKSNSNNGNNSSNSSSSKDGNDKRASGYDVLSKPFGDLSQSITTAFANTEKDYIEKTKLSPKGREGATAVMALVRKLENDIIVANAGDSKCVVCRTKAEDDQDLSFDHKPNDPKERERIVKHGGFVYGHFVFIDNVPSYMYRIYKKDTREGGLNLSRALGDTFYGEMVPHTPDFIQVEKRKDDLALVLGSDGVWDVLSTTDVCDLVRCNAKDYQAASDSLVAAACIQKSTDNITAVVVRL